MARSSATAPISIAVVGTPDATQIIRGIVEGKKAQDREIKVLCLTADQASSNVLKSCQAVFFLSPSVKDLPAELRALQETPALTIGEAPDFCAAGGMVNFRIEENRLRFEVNVSAAERGRIRVSSKLLKLAVRVLGGPSSKADDGPAPDKKET